MSLITPVILVGGSGKRLWPLSRESMPKQFVPLLGKQSTFQQTLLRVADRGLFGRPVIATNDAYRFMAEQQAREIGIEIDILVEPARRDSGPAMAAAAAYCKSQGATRRAGAGLRPSGDRRSRSSSPVAARRWPPSSRAASSPSASRRPSPRPTTATSGPAASRSAPVLKVAAFVEKPDAADGAALHRRRPAVEQRQLPVPARHAAVGDGALRARHGGGRRGGRAPRPTRSASTVFLDAEAFDKAPAKSIDYAVMERTDKCWVVPARFRWSDLGTWDALLDVGNADSAGQRHRGPGRDRPCAQLLRPLGRTADRRDRRRGGRGRGDERRRPGRPSRQPPAPEGRRAAHVGRQAQRRDRACRDAPAVGQLPGHRPRRALPRQAPHRQAGRQAQPAEPLPPRRALGRRQGRRRGHARRQDR